MKKVTMRDVAKLAEVSIATVSYVLNNNKKESIPEETRNRVNEAMIELNYIPNLTARALTRKKSGLVGIFIMGSETDTLLWRKCIYSEFISELIKQLYEVNYHVIVEYIDPSKGKLDIIYERALDGAFLIDINKKYIYEATSIFKVPIILIDSYIDDTLFHKILLDYNSALKDSISILENEEPFVVVDCINSKELIQVLYTSKKIRDENIYVAKKIDDFLKFLKENSHRSGIIFNEFLAILAEKYISPEKIVVVCLSGNEYLLKNYKHKLSICNKEKAQKATDIMVDYIKKDYHSNKLSLVELKYY